MTLSIREQVLEAFKQTLINITGIDGLTVERNRADPVQEFPKLVMRDGGHQVTHENSGMMGYRLTVDVEGYVAGQGSGTALNALYAKVVEAVLEDRTLGELAADSFEISMDIALDNLAGNAPCAAFNTTFQIDFYTLPGDPTSLAP